MTNKPTVNTNLWDGSSIEIFEDEHGQLALRDRDNERTYHKVEVTLLFPLTKRRSYIQFSSDEEEIGILRSMKRLDEKSKQVLTTELERTYFIPTISKIYSIETKIGSDAWHVATAKGDRRFEVTGKRRNIRFYPGGLVVIKDLDGNRYEIKDMSSLDHQSRKVLEREL